MLALSLAAPTLLALAVSLLARALAVLALAIPPTTATGLTADRLALRAVVGRHVGRRLGGVGQRGGRVGAHGQLDLAGGHPGRAQQRADFSDLIRGGHGDDSADGAGAGGAARPVDVGLVLGRRIGVDDEPDVVDVDAAGGDVGRHEHGRLAGGERVEVPHAGVLRQVAVQVHARHAAAGELLGQALGAVLGAGEHDGPRVRAGEVGEGADAVVGVDVEHVVRGRSGCGRAVVHRVVHRVGEEPGHQLLHARVEGRGEQQPLGVRRGRRQDAGDAGQEAQVGHVIGFVEDADLDAVQAAVLLAHEVLEAAGAGHDDVDAAVQRVHLAALGHAAENHGGLHAEGVGERREGLVDLAGELAGRGEDEAARRVAGAATAGGGQTRDEREAERVGLAGAGATAAEHVTAGQGVGQRRRLDRRRGGDARAAQDVEQGGRNAEIGERT